MSKLDDKLKQWYHEKSGVMLSDDEVTEMRATLAAFGEMMLKWVETSPANDETDKKVISE